MKERIERYIKELEDYPRMFELVGEFFRTHYDGTPDLNHNTEFLTSLLDLLSEGKIFYDSKHDAWLYTGGPLKGEFVSLSELS